MFSYGKLKKFILRINFQAEIFFYLDIFHLRAVVAKNQAGQKMTFTNYQVS